MIIEANKENWYVLYDFSIISGEYVVRVVDCHGYPLEIEVVEELRGKTRLKKEADKAADGYAMMACYRLQLESRNIINCYGLLHGEYSEAWLQTLG